MFTETFHPRFKDTDALGHVNNAVFATWFEEGRRPFFEFFVPGLNVKDWNLIVARFEIDFLAPGAYSPEVTVKSQVEKIGNSSFTIYQECYQNGKQLARGKVVIVHYDYAAKQPKAIPDSVRAKLREHVNPAAV